MKAWKKKLAHVTAVWCLSMASAILPASFPFGMRSRLFIMAYREFANQVTYARALVSYNRGNCYIDQHNYFSTTNPLFQLAVPRKQQKPQKMCILIIRTWSSCDHMRATSTDKCHTCLGTPGMMEYDCPNATTHYPIIEPDWPCPVCHDRQRADFSTSLPPTDHTRDSLWQSEQTTTHSNSSLSASEISFGDITARLQTPENALELTTTPQLAHEIRSNAPSPSPHGSPGTISPQEESPIIDASDDESNTCAKTTTTSSIFGGVPLHPPSPSSVHAQSLLPTATAVTLLPFSHASLDPLHNWDVGYLCW
ncbi:hypothetical protein DOTSEDRAFT_55584 [Dothistroma septosporum NZE10]|uniref:Uncharacterized protein n=1 Tax=Dothistroma septosporum (strain NZE10 / CBS 128990) TaxID=675120 RepID=N1PID6_DOTSN|nr:hypothetical protein DOTSEDRAFT_55584 [Dothistroma septosporum NZE10]